MENTPVASTRIPTISAHGALNGYIFLIDSDLAGAECAHQLQCSGLAEGELRAM